MIKLLLSNFGFEWHLKTSVSRGIPFKFQKPVLHTDWSYRKNTITWYSTVWCNLSQTEKCRPLISLTFPEGIIIMEKQLHHISIHPDLLLFPRNTIIRKPRQRQLALKYDADSEALDKPYCHFTSLGVTAFPL